MPERYRLTLFYINKLPDLNNLLQENYSCAFLQ